MLRHRSERWARAMSPSGVRTESRFMPARIQESFTPGASRRRFRPPSTGYIEGDPSQTERLSGPLSKTGFDKVRTCTGNGRSVHARQRHRSSRRQSDSPNATRRGEARSVQPLRELWPRSILSKWLHLPRWNWAQDIPAGGGTQDWRFVTEQLRAVLARPVALFKGMR
jgi:hypothetical protein